MDHIIVHNYVVLCIFSGLGDLIDTKVVGWYDHVALFFGFFFNFFKPIATVPLS